MLQKMQNLFLCKIEKLKYIFLNIKMFWTKEPEPPPKDHTGAIIIILLLFILVKYGKKSLQFQIFKPTNKLHEVVGLETVKKEIEYYMEFIKNKKNIWIGR